MSTDPALPEHPDYIDPSSDDLPAPHRAERRIRAYLTASVLDGILDAADPGDGHPRPLYRRDLHALINNSHWVSDALQLCETQLAASHDATRRAVVTAHNTQQRLDKAITALSEYFKGTPIGPDIAPRITEMRSDLMARAHAAERARDNAYAEREQLRYERRLLGAARLTLDLVAAGDHSRWPQARREAQDLAQRLVDEIGHPVTDEDALGPTYREQLAHAEAARDRAHFELNRVYTAGLYIADCLERHADSSGSAAVSGFAADLRAVLTGARQQGSADPDGIPAAAAGHGRSAVSGGEPVERDRTWSHWDCNGNQVRIAPGAPMYENCWIVSAAAGGTILTRAAATDLYAWLGQVLRQAAPTGPDQPEPLTVQQLDQHRADYAAADTDTTRADVLGDLLADWYQAWPDSAATDPHQPIAAEILRIVATTPASSTPGPATRAIALGAAARLMAAQLDRPDALVRDLEQITVAMADRLAEWVCTGDYDWTSSTGSSSAGSGRAVIPPRRAGAHGCA